jgi:hypothetical protein
MQQPFNTLAGSGGDGQVFNRRGERDIEFDHAEFADQPA